MDDRKSKISHLSSRPSDKTTLRARRKKKGNHLIWKITRGWRLLLLLFLLGILVLLWRPFMNYVSFLENNISQRAHVLLRKIGFQVDDLIVEGRSLTSQKDILKAVGIQRGDSLFEANLDGIKKRLEALSWVRTATVQRQWPFLIYIRLAEYKPIALWQRKAEFFLVDDQGHYFAIPKDSPFRTLPILTGEGAPQKAPQLFLILQDFPSIMSRMTGAIFLGKRRWDLMLDNRLKLKLAESNIKESLQQFMHMEESHKITDKNIVAIDLRFKDKIYFQLAPEAAEVKLSSKEA